MRLFSISDSNKFWKFWKLRLISMCIFYFSEVKHVISIHVCISYVSRWYCYCYRYIQACYFFFFCKLSFLSMHLINYRDGMQANDKYCCMFMWTRFACGLVNLKEDRAQKECSWPNNAPLLRGVEKKKLFS